MPQGPTSDAPAEVAETRQRPRYTMLAMLEAQFAGQPALVRNLSERGIGLRHAAQVKIGASVMVRIEAPENDTALPFRCRVVWSRMSRHADERGRRYYDTGLLLLDDTPAAGTLMGRLIDTYGLLDADSLDAKRRALDARARLREGTGPEGASPAAPRITPDQVLLIREAQEFLASDPERAARWLERAKQSLVKLGLVAPDAKSTAHRAETLVIWEYLGRSLDLDVVSAIATMQPEG